MVRQSKIFFLALSVFLLNRESHALQQSIMQTLTNKIGNFSSKIISPFVFVHQHSLACVTITAVSSALYLGYVRSQGDDWAPVISESNNITHYLNDTTACPDATFGMYWKLKEWPTAQTLNKNKEQVKKLLGPEKKTIIPVINTEKAKLETILKKLQLCLTSCSLIPELQLTPIEKPLEISLILENLKKKLVINPDTKFHDLTDSQVIALQNAMNKKIYVPLLNIFKVARHLIFPFEWQALRESWKVYQLIMRLEVIERIIQE